MSLHEMGGAEKLQESIKCWQGCLNNEFDIDSDRRIRNVLGAFLED